VTPLERRFHDAMLDICRRAKGEASYDEAHTLTLQRAVRRRPDLSIVPDHFSNAA
jgi:hypothetical protein